MGYDARVLEVMIASPGDVTSERQIVREVLHQWNDTNSKDRRLVLLPISWETHSTPEMGDRPQAFINRDVLADCDLLVGIFWTRIGTPTGQSVSGTVEEIDEHLNAGKPAMLYFSSAPAPLDRLDTEQYRKLAEFKDACFARGILTVYASLEEFRQKFLHQLSRKIIRSFDGLVNSGVDSFIIQPEASALGTEARALLLEAAADAQGLVFKDEDSDGLTIQTNGKQFVETGNPRSAARWMAAIRELEALGLLEDKGHTGAAFATLYCLTWDG